LNLLDDAEFDISSNELDELIADLEKEDNASITFGSNTPPPKRNSLTELAKKATQAQVLLFMLMYICLTAIA
jgi:uncharacterized tellurite resistance protein B-like protein